jgi:hypothetical protein
VIRRSAAGLPRPGFPASSGVIALAIAVISLAINPAPAPAAATRAEYVAQVDPICHAADLKGKRLFEKHRLPKAIDLGSLQYGGREGQLIVARQIVLNNRRVVGPSIASISTIPPPPGDEVLISTWIGDLRFYKRNTDKAARAIRKGKPHRAYHLIVATFGPIFEDAEALEPWGFQYCTS